jgi:hypothetical protein
MIECGGGEVEGRGGEEKTFGGQDTQSMGDPWVVVTHQKLFHTPQTAHTQLLQSTAQTKSNY